MKQLKMSQSSSDYREAGEVFIFMHRYFRASRNIRAHWFFDHLNRQIQAPYSDVADTSPKEEDEYAKEMEVVGVVPKEGCSDDEIVEGEKFTVTMDTKVTYISRYYRHVFVLDLSPSTIVADDQSGGCLHGMLLHSLKMAMTNASKSFKIPGTNRTFTPQIYTTICVFTPFLGFDQDLVLIQGILLTESNVDTVLECVEAKFKALLLSLYKYSQPILGRWAAKRRRTRCKYDSTCDADRRMQSESDGRMPSRLTAVKSVLPHDKSLERPPPQKRTFDDGLEDLEEMEGVMGYTRGVWHTNNALLEDDECDDVCDGYIHPEWALIFMLRMGLMAVQMLPENTQCNIVILTDAVCGMPDAVALHQLLGQLRSYTVSCSFIQIHGKSRSEPCFGHVSSSELFHFLAMATFGAFIPNCRCSLGEVDSDFSSRVTTPRVPEPLSENTRNPSGGSTGRRASDEIPPGPSAGAAPGKINAFHRALVCWCFQNALQENIHIRNVVNDINPVFAAIYSSDSVRHRYLELFYYTSVHELLYVRLREGYTLKEVKLENDEKGIQVHLKLPFRPLVFIEYIIHGSWPIVKNTRETIRVNIAITAPYHVMKDLLSEDGDFVNMARQKGIKVFRNTLDSLIEADRLLVHLHSFNQQRTFYTVPFGVSTKYSLFKLSEHQSKIALEMPNADSSMKGFVEFWRILCNLDEGVWQKWVHTHNERVLLKVDSIPADIFEEGSNSKVSCERALCALHELLREETSFCLLQRLGYVKFIYSDSSELPSYFYMIRVCMEPPCLTIKVAFLGGISSSHRKQICDHLRRSLIDLQLKSRTESSAHDNEGALCVVRRPVERVLVRYRTVPENWRCIVRLKENRERETLRNLTLHNALSKYLSCRRRIWNLPCVFEATGCHLTGSSKEHAAFLLMVLLHRRVADGFNVAWSENGIVGACRQLVAQTGFALEQYVFFPPQTLHLPYRVNRNRLPSARYKDEEEEDDYGIVFEPGVGEQSLDSESLTEENYTWQAIVEYWSEPNVHTEQLPGESGEDPEQMKTKKIPPNPCHDDDIMCVLFTLDQLLRWCTEGPREPLTIKLTSPVKTEEEKDPAHTLSSCVSVLVQPFSLLGLLLEAEKHLLILPLFANDTTNPNPSRIKLLLDATLRELEAHSDCFLDVEDSILWHSVMGDQTSGTTETRMFLHRVSQWTMIAMIIPRNTSELVEQKGIPILFCLCDEPTISYRLAHREKPAKMVVEDLRIPEESWSIKPAKTQLFVPPDAFVWATRCTDIQKGMYKPFNLVKYAKDVRELVCGRAAISAVFKAINNRMEVAPATVQTSIDEYCDSVAFEIPGVGSALKKFCKHINKASGSADNLLSPEEHKICCNTSDFDKLFENVVGKNFQPIPGYEHYYIYKKGEKRPRERKQTDRNPLSMIDQQYYSSGDKTPDESENAPNLTVRGNSAPPAPMKGGKYSTDRHPSEHPLFVYFLCALQFPDGTMETFPIAQMPQCIYQLIEKCPSLPPDPYKIDDVKVSMEMYMLSWMNGDEEEDNANSTPGMQSYSFVKKSNFSRNLPETELEDVKRLLKGLNRLLEMEVILVDSRKQNVTNEKLKRISDFIGKEFREGGGADGKIDQRERALQLVKNDDEAVLTLKSRLHEMRVEYFVLRRAENSDMFYCCSVEDSSTYENEHKRSRRESRKSSAQNTAGSRQFSQESSSLSSTLSGTPTSMQASSIRDGSVRSISLDPESVPSAELNPPMVPSNNDAADFWLILTVTDKLLYQFCRRHPDGHDRLFELMWRKVRQTVRVINQEMLLEKLDLNRECDSLLLTGNDSERFLEPRMSLADNDVEEPRVQITDAARFTYEPGYFACDMKYYKWFYLHPRVRNERQRHNTTTSGSTKKKNNAIVTTVGFDALRNEMQNLSVINETMEFLYVLREPDGNVIYMMLHHSKDTVKEFIRNEKKTWWKTVSANFDQRHTHVLLSVHGVNDPNEEFIGRFIDKLQKRLDNTTLDHLVQILSMNTHARLEGTDVQFIQRYPQDPSAVFHYRVPIQLEGFTRAFLYYAQQQMEANLMFPAKCKDESGSRSEHTEDRLSFSPLLCPSGRLPANYAPVFNLHLKRPQGGNRSTGIAAIEMRLVDWSREFYPLRNGRLNSNNHNMFSCAQESRAQRLAKYAQFTRIESINSEELTGKPGAFVEVVVWQAGDVGLEELQAKMIEVLQQACCDVVTEFGILNCKLFEYDQSGLPMSPNIVNTPPNKTPSTGASINRDRLIRQRSSSEAQTPSGTPALISGHRQTLMPIQQQASLTHFNFDVKPASVASDLDRHDKLSSVGDNSRANEVVNDDFMQTAFDWFTHVKSIGASESSHCVYRSEELGVDSVETCRRAIEGLVEHLSPILQEGNDLHDRIVVAERRESGRFELHKHAATIKSFLEFDLGREIDPTELEAPDIVMMALVPSVAEETRRYGFDPEGEPPDKLLTLARNGNKEQFPPSLNPFIPRQRIMFVACFAEKIHIFLYNFLPNYAGCVSSLIVNSIHLHNARSRLLREIGLHKCGISHVTNLKIRNDEPHSSVMWKSPRELLKEKEEAPPDRLERRTQELEDSRIPYLHTLHKIYRSANSSGAFLSRRMMACQWEDQTEQLRILREDVERRLDSYILFSKIRDNIMANKKKYIDISEEKLNRLTSAARLVHFVQTPVLFFPVWRKRVADIRQTVDAVHGAESVKEESVKSAQNNPNAKKPPLPPSDRDRKASANPTISSGGGTPPYNSPRRLRSNTLSNPPNSHVPPPQFSKDLPDPWNIEVLYMLVNEYAFYLKQSFGMKPFITNPCHLSTNPRYTLKYDKRYTRPPELWLSLAVPGGIVLVHLAFQLPYFVMRVRSWNGQSFAFTAKNRDATVDSVRFAELEALKDKILAGCHIHSFTYDFHLRILANYLAGKKDSLFGSGYNTNSFLADFLQYYECRPPYAVNCIYEERIHFEIQYNVPGREVWQHFLDNEKLFKWKAFKMKTCDVGDFDYMLVTNPQSSTDSLKVVMYDVERASSKSASTKKLYVMYYVVQISEDLIEPVPEPVPEVKERVNSRRIREPSNGEFRQIANANLRASMREKRKQRELDDMLRQVSQGTMPDLEGRRRFSSGGHRMLPQPQNVKEKTIHEMDETEGSLLDELSLDPVIPQALAPNSLLSPSPSVDEVVMPKPTQTQTPIKIEPEEEKMNIHSGAPRRHRKNADSDGDIPEDTATYLHYLSLRQGTLQKNIEDTVKQYHLKLKSYVDDAEGMCRVDRLWNKIMMLPIRSHQQQQSAIAQLLQKTENRSSMDPWQPFTYAQHDEDEFQPQAADLETLTSLVTKENMDVKEPLLRSLLVNVNHVRFARFVLARFGPKQCRFFFDAHRYKKCIVITNPNLLNTAFLVTLLTEVDSPTIEILFKDRDVLECLPETAHKCAYVDRQFDEIVKVCHAFLWGEHSLKSWS